MKKIIIAASILATFVMSGCRPETRNQLLGIPDDAILLSTENFTGNGTKTAVSGTTVQWVTDDTVYLNGSDYEVTVADGNAYVGASEDIRNYEVYGYHGVTGTPSWNSSDKKLTVTVPSEYKSSYDGAGRQVIALPMVAYKSGAADNIEFKHVSAAVRVRIKNTTGVDVYLDKVVVKSEGTQLSGNVEVTLTNVDGLGANYTSTIADRQVTIKFDNTIIDYYDDNDENIKEVQVPILPFSEGNLTIEVYTHSLIEHSGDDEGLLTVNHSYNFSAKKSAPSLARNVMLTANVNIQVGGESHPNMEDLDHSVFSVSGTKAVRFSKGNLQYIGSAATPYWKFAATQYEYFGTTTGQNSDAANKDRDLFGWGTKNNPEKTASDNSQYSWNEWGENTISNGGIGWRTLTYDEWYFLLFTRTVSSKGLSGSNSGTARFCAVKISDTWGWIIFPDNYIHPEGVTPSLASTYNASNSGSTVLSIADWGKMQAAGAVFLPGAGSRNGTSVANVNSYLYYWSSTEKDDSKARSISSGKWSYTIPNDVNKFMGYSVRLVKEVTASAK